MHNFESPAPLETPEKFFTDVSFVEKKDKKGVVLAYESSAKGRKTIRLAPGTTPDLLKSHRVKTIDDSNPDDPFSGFYTVEIVRDENTDWSATEGNVLEAEGVARQLHKSRVDLFQETGMTAEARGAASEEEVLNHADRPRVAAKAHAREQRLNEELDEALGEDDSFEREFVSFQRGNLRKALSEEREINKKIEALQKEEAGILRTIGEEPNGSEIEALNEIRDELEHARSRHEQLMVSSPEAYYGLHLKELKGYKDDLENGRIVETPYVVKHIEDVVSHLRAGKPIMIYGHLGSGKTELALHVARNYILQDRPDIDAAIDKEFTEWLAANPDVSIQEQTKERNEIDASCRSALVISGSKNMSTSEFYGHQILDIEKIKKEELDAFTKDVESRYEQWMADNKEKLDGLDPEVAEQEKNRAHDRLLQTYLTQFKGGTISSFFLGPIYRAMAEGRPIVIDEVNAIPHQLLIGLNHVLTRKPGDEVNVQQNSGSAITVKEGYGVVMTGNLNQGDGRYIDRQDMDPAFLSRVYKVEYDYLPQATEGSLDGEAGEGNELFHILLAKVMDKHGNAEVPEGSIDQIWNLAKAARVIQNVFAGKETNSAYYFKEGGGRGIQYILKESVLSIRALDKIITQWQKEGYKNELDHYVWTEFVSQSTNPMDKAYLYQLLKDQFGFFATAGWEQKPNYGTGGVINSFNIKAPGNTPEAVEFLGPRATVDFAFGEGPQREEWPRGENAENKAPDTKQAVPVQKSPEKSKTPEAIASEMQSFLLDAYKKWHVNQRFLEDIEWKPASINPKDIDYRIAATEQGPEECGEYIVNPETMNIDWDTITPDRIMTIQLPSHIVGGTYADIGEYIKGSFPKGFKFPGIEYMDYMTKNPDKVPEALRNEKISLLFFGSLFRQPDGAWYVPSSSFLNNFGPNGFTLESKSKPVSRVVLLRD